MSISVLNNISSLRGEDAVSNTQTSLQATLNQLSTGLKINSGSDDAAGLAIAVGLGANIAALTQSSQNASNGIGLLQTADGALSQVTTQLNRAVTLATEASNGGLTTSESAALNNEFNSILNEINQIGSTTNYNGTSVRHLPAGFGRQPALRHHRSHHRFGHHHHG
jgi:flagellin